MTLGRRGFLGRLGLGAGWLALGAPGLAVAAAPTDRRLVVVVLRGALDGLAAVPPLGDPDYRRLRGALALPAPGEDGGALALDGFFGLHPALAPLAGLYARGEALVVHAAATPYRERSHFDAQDLLENGTTRPRGAADGWLNRAIAAFGQGDRRLGLAVGQQVPLILRGPVPVASWQPEDQPPPAPDLLASLERLYARDPVFSRAFSEGLAAHRMSAAALGEDHGGMAGPAAARAAVWFPRVATAAGKLLAAGDGPRVAVMELGGWDTHAGQGAARGRLSAQLRVLGNGIDALRTALGDTWRRTVVVAATEFGRTVAVNGTGGTDHGTAGAMLLAGGAVAGGRVAGTWPGLAPDRLHEGRDLAPTTDFRAVMKGVLADHMGLPRAVLDATVFPASAAVPPMRGLVRA